MGAMKSVYFALLLCTLLLSACNQEKPAPQKAAVSSATNKVILSTTEAPGSDLKMRIAFDPPQPRMSSKTNFHLWVHGGVHFSPENPAQAQCSLVMPLMDMGKNEVPLKPVGHGEFEGTGQFTMSGEWEVVCTATSKDNGRTLSGKTTFNVRVGD